MSLPSTPISPRMALSTWDFCTLSTSQTATRSFSAEPKTAKEAPTPHLADGHPDFTGFWAPAGWGYAVTQGALSADGKTRYTQRAAEGPAQSADKKRELKNRLEGANLPPYKPEFVEKVKYL